VILEILSRSSLSTTPFLGIVTDDTDSSVHIGFVNISAAEANQSTHLPASADILNCPHAFIFQRAAECTMYNHHYWKCAVGHNSTQLVGTGKTRSLFSAAIAHANNIMRCQVIEIRWIGDLAGGGRPRH
jgi:hypothetical protein